jgi:beta-1,4-mannosyltransferase
MAKNRVYVFPTILKGEKKKNSYIENLISALSDTGSEVINFRNVRKRGVADLFLHLDANKFVLNWPENLAARKYGGIQVLLYFVFLLAAKGLRKNLIFILHNKKAHNHTSFLSKLCLSYTARWSNSVLTHSKDGLAYYRSTYGKNNVYFFPHPVYPEARFVASDKNLYDFIIWGSIEPYKNVLGFLEYLVSDGRADKYKILVCGSCKNQTYASQIDVICRSYPNITFRNEFLSEQVLGQYIAESKAILFTYNESSVLSSGALVYSLGSRKVIIGPAVGSFKELSKEGLIATYTTFSQIFDLYKTFQPDVDKIEDYLTNNTWQAFARFVDSHKTGAEIQ